MADSGVRSTTPTERLRSAGFDRPTLHALLQLGMWGFWLYGFGPSVPLLRDDFGVSSALAGLHSTASALGAIVAGTLGVRVVNRIGRGAARTTGGYLLVVGAALYLLAPSLAISIPAAFIAGTGGAVIVNTLNVSVLQHHGRRGTAWLTSTHAMGSTLGILAPLLMGVAIAVGLGWRSALAVVPVVIVVAHLSLRRHSMRGDARSDAGEQTAAHAPAPTHRAHQRLGARYWWILGGLLAITAVEFCTTLWATDLLRVRHGLDDANAALGFSLLLVGMATSRWLSIPIVTRMGTKRPIAVGLVFALLGAVVTPVTTTPTGGLLGLTLLGIGLGPLYPLIIGRAIAAAPHAPDRAANMASIWLGVVVGVAPFALGAAADVVGITAAFVAVPASVVASGLCLAMARRRHT